MHTMHRSLTVFLTLLICLGFSSCADLADMPKVVLGTSTRALEEERIDAMVRVFRCEFDDCYQAVLDMARLDEDHRAVNSEGMFNIFQHDRIDGLIVVMGIPGNIDTTEVGIFLTMMRDRSVKVEVSSRSTSAKKKVAKEVFKELNTKFQEI